MAEATQPIEKFNGATRDEIDRLAKEYIESHKIVDSPDFTQRINLVNKREDALGKVRTGLESIVSSALGDKIYADKTSADTIIYNLVAKGYEADGLKLPEDPKKREEVLHRYLANAGVDYTQLVKQIINTRRPTKFAELPDEHPLKILMNYIANQSHSEARRLQFIQQRLVSLGDVHAPTVAAAFNKYGGTRLDTRFAKPQETLQNYQQLVQAERAKYETNAPDKVYNAAWKGKKAA